MEILADYGTAHAFLLYLRHRFGADLLRRLHRDNGQDQRIGSVQRALRAERGKPTFTDVLRDYQLMTLADRIAGRDDAQVAGVRRKVVSLPDLRSTVNLLNPAALGTPGAAPNGADYLMLQGVGPTGLGRGELRSVRFAGDRTLPPTPLSWSSVPQLPGIPLENPALFSGNGSGTDASAVFRGTVPSVNPTLTYLTSYQTEPDFDYGFTVISTDGGRTYTTLANGNTTPTVAPAPAGSGFTGSTTLPTWESFDLSAYAGKSVLLGFRYLSDQNTDLGGWYIDDVRLGGRLINDGSTLDDLRTFTEIRPLPVAGWSVQIVGLDPARDRGFLDPAGTATTNAPYELRVNDIGQAGGRE